MKFPYLKFKGRHLPIVSIKLKIKNSKQWVEEWVYVDSGAGYSVFHPYVAEILGLKLENGKKDFVTVGDGSQIPIYLHRITIELAGVRFRARVGFSKQLGIGFNILGRLDIFKKFRICFVEKEKIIDILKKA